MSDIQPQQLTPLTTSYVGDVCDVLRQLPERSVHTAVTSPPYYGLRSYLPKGHHDKAREIGTEKTPSEYVEKLVTVFRELRRVLRDDGCLWLNLGDSYASQGGPQVDGTKQIAGSQVGAWNGTSRRPPVGLKAKDLIGVPWMVAFALRDDGWYLRSAAPWVKRNAMPESTTDRPGSSLEYVFLLAKSPRYFFDAEAVKRPVAAAAAKVDFGEGTSASRRSVRNATGSHSGRNRRNGDWWFESVGMMLSDDGEEILGFDVVPKSYKGAHFACMPPKLIEPCIKSATSEAGCCGRCGSPLRRVVEKTRTATRPATDTKVEGIGSESTGNRDPERHVTATATVGWERVCGCDDSERIPATVLDPFGGSGTTAEVCQQLGRRCVLIDLNGDYVKLQRERTGATA